MSTEFSSATGRGGRPHARRRRSRLASTVAAAVVVVVGVVGGYGAYWLVIASQLQAGVEDWVDEHRDQGYVISHEGIVRSGFPRLVRAHVRSPSVSAPPASAPLTAAAAWTWSPEEVTVALDPWDPTRVTVALDGRHRLAVGDIPDRRVYRMEIGQLDVVAEAGSEAVALRLRDLVVKASADPGRVLLTVAALDGTGRALPMTPDVAPAVDAGTAHYAFTAEAVRMVFPGAERAPLGRELERLVVDATVQGELPAALSGPALLRWRDDGGAIDVSRLEASYGPVDLSGEGAAALDERGQPIAAFSTRIRGLFDAIDALRRHGYLEPGAAMAATIALRMLAGSAGRDAVLEVPVTLQDRVLSVGPLDLLQMPEIRWLRSE